MNNKMKTKAAAWVWMIVVFAMILLIVTGTWLFSNTNAGSDNTGSSGIISKPADTGGNTNNPPVPTPTPTSTSTPTPTPSPQPKTYNIDIKNYAYTPSTLTINKGDSIIWTNQDSVRHTVTSDSGNELDSELFGKGETYSNTFNTQGTFNYYCKPHPYMKGKIIVE